MSNIYLFVGENQISKLNRLKRLKKELLSSGVADFNLEILSAKDLNLKSLEESLLRLPVKAEKRLLIIHDIQNLSPVCQERLISYVRRPHQSLILILEADRLSKEMDKIARYSQVLHFRKERPLNVFDLGRAIENKRRTQALSILSSLLLKGERPEKILGGLIWKWEQMQRYLSGEKIARGFKALLEADLNIKLSRTRADTALELLIVKLMLLV